MVKVIFLCNYRFDVYPCGLNLKMYGWKVRFDKEVKTINDGIKVRTFPSSKVQMVLIFFDIWNFSTPSLPALLLQLRFQSKTFYFFFCTFTWSVIYFVSWIGILVVPKFQKRLIVTIYIDFQYFLRTYWLSWLHLFHWGLNRKLCPFW